MTIPYSDRTVYVAARTAEGALWREIERYLDAPPNRNNVPWALLRTNIQTSFLSAHKEDRLRDEVDKTMQNAYEGTASYGRRFRDVCDLANPADIRNILTMTMTIFYSTIDIQIKIIIYNSLENQIINWSGDYY